MVTLQELADEACEDYQNYSSYAENAASCAAYSAGSGVLSIGAAIYNSSPWIIVGAGIFSAAQLVHFGYNLLRARQERRDWERSSAKLDQYIIEHPSETLEERADEDETEE